MQQTACACEIKQLSHVAPSKSPQKGGKRNKRWEEYMVMKDQMIMDMLGREGMKWKDDLEKWKGESEQGRFFQNLNINCIWEALQAI